MRGQHVSSVVTLAWCFVPIDAYSMVQGHQEKKTDIKSDLKKKAPGRFGDSDLSQAAGRVVMRCHTGISLPFGSPELPQSIIFKSRFFEVELASSKDYVHKSRICLTHIIIQSGILVFIIE